MPVKMYKAHHYHEPKVTTVEVAKVTDHSVFLMGGRREGISTQYYSFHKTFEDAKAACVSVAQRELSEAQNRTNYATNKLRLACLISQPD